MTEKFADLVVLGGGSGGYACAFRAASLGMSVVLVEQDKLGGTCLHRGCIPTKALLHAAEVADTVRDSARFGVPSSMGSIDVAGVHSYKERVIGKLYSGLLGLAETHRITRVHGTGTLIGPNCVEVDGERWMGRNIVLATGSRARSLPGLPIGGRIITSDQALELGYVPERVLVLGGGVIGVEFASLWKSFGADVTVLEALPRLLPAEDAFASKHLARAFRRRGISVRTGVRFAGVTHGSSGVQVTLESGDRAEAEVLLVAVGRGPNSEGLGYQEAGVKTEGGCVVTDERLRTSQPNVYAVGDLVAGPQLAHRGFQHGIFVAEEIAGHRPEVIDEAGIPRVTYCRPEVASVGLSEVAAKERYGSVETAVYDLAGNGRSQILAGSGGVKVIRAPGGPVVGMTLVGERAGELIGEAQLIYNWRAAPEDVARFLHAHPTQGEALGEAHLALAGKPLHTHG